MVDVNNISPAPGTPIRPETRIAFDVTNVVELAHVAVVVAQGQLRESAYDGTAFAPGYALSTIAAIANGYRFTIARIGGWIAPPTFSVVAVDGGGNKL